MTAYTLVNKLKDQLSNQASLHHFPKYIYTYPLKTMYQPCKDWQETIKHGWRNYSGPINIYLHIPFCKMKCAFCDLFTVIAKDKNIINTYVDALLHELSLYEGFIDTKQVEINSIYFGGGTPALLSAQHLTSILNNIRKIFPKLSDLLEISIEGTPDAFSKQYLTDLKQLGFGRVSIGVQSFDADELKAINRKYPANLSFEIPVLAKKLGIKNVNIDLIYGLPDQTEQQWRSNITKAIATNADTITAYPLVIKPKTTYGKQLRQDKIDHVTYSQIYQYHDILLEALTVHGYQQITFVNFAKQGGGCSHEFNEFNGIPTLALGVGARTYAPHCHYANDDYVNKRTNKQLLEYYFTEVNNNRIPIKSSIPLSTEDKMHRYVLLGLLGLGIDRIKFNKRFNTSPLLAYQAFFEVLANEQLISVTDDTIRLLPAGKRLSNIIGNLFMRNYVL